MFLINDSDKILTTSFDKTARLWNINFEKQEVIYWGHGAEVVDVKFSLYEDIIATASLDGTAKIYQVVTGNFMRKYFWWMRRTRQTFSLFKSNF